MPMARACAGKELVDRRLSTARCRRHFHEIRLKARADAPPITELVDYRGFCGQAAAEGAAADSGAPERFARVTVAEAASRMSEGWKPYVLDVRSAAEAQIVSLRCACGTIVEQNRIDY